MCQIIGISYSKPYSWNKTWDKFRLRAAGNPDGWGVAYGDIYGLAVIKQPDRADRSPLAAALGIVSLPAPVMIGHIRLATRGEPALVNTHPFFARAGGRDWAMVHNGHLSGYNMAFDQLGQTDSEAFFQRLISWLQNNDENDPYIIAHFLAYKALETGIYGKLNILLTDGEYMFVHTNLKGSLYWIINSHGVMFCTQPLTRQKGWKPLDEDRVHVFKDGEFVYRTDIYSQLKGKVV
ncbi:MAG: class II glutamine amidotransferase [Bacillota bacterium]